MRPRDGGSFGVTLWGVREFEGTFALSGLLNGSWVAGRFSAATNVQLERRFASGADPLDVIVRLAANVDVLHRHDALRVGVEYVGQDLEDAIEGEEAEGGGQKQRAEHQGFSRLIGWPSWTPREEDARRGVFIPPLAAL